MNGMSREEMISFVEEWFETNKEAMAKDLSKTITPLLTTENKACLELVVNLSQRLFTTWVPALVITLLEANNDYDQKRKAKSEQ